MLTMPMKFCKDNVLTGTWEESFIDTSKNDGSDVGFGSYRQTMTKNFQNINYEARAISVEQKQEFDDFYKENGGMVGLFNWYNISDDTVKTARFASPPSSRIVSKVKGFWNIQISLMVEV